MSDRRLIEVAFPLRETSLDSVHEKNVRHGHISTLHIWPARRPLAASRAALIATLLPDPGNDVERKELLKRLAGEVVEEVDDEGNVKITTKGGILHWGRESGPDLVWFRKKIREAYNGRAPRVLDPFSGGGAIPLEAMRLGCEAIAADINPVAWLILKCTLEYPQKLAGQTRPLPEFAARDPEFRAQFLKAHGIKTPSTPKGRKPKRTTAPNDAAQIDIRETVAVTPALAGAELAWHVRAWGRSVLEQAKAELAKFYPVYVDLFVPADGTVREWRLLTAGDDPEKVVEALNAELAPGSLLNPQNPRWTARPVVAYLWARTVACKKCSVEIPLLKTRWLCSRRKKRARLTMKTTDALQVPGGKSVQLGVELNVPTATGTAAERRATESEIAAGTMSRSGARCPNCGQENNMDDLRTRVRDGRSGTIMTAVVVDDVSGKNYRVPRPEETQAAEDAVASVEQAFQDVPWGPPQEPTPGPSGRRNDGSNLTRYGLMRWRDIFTGRQLCAAAAVIKATRNGVTTSGGTAEDEVWREALSCYLAIGLARLVDRNSVSATWQLDSEKVRNTFARFAFPITWDFCEICPWADSSGSYPQAIEWIAEVVEHASNAALGMPPPSVVLGSALVEDDLSPLDCIITDPPYYDAVPYSNLMDFFHVWHRRVLVGLSKTFDSAFAQARGPKWSTADNDGELVEDPSRFECDGAAAKQAYEDGMFRAFQVARKRLAETGRLVIVFANKQPDAWETLVAAIIRAGFVVTGSWPIQTERQARTRSLSSAALSSSVWLVCRKRPATARAGWDNAVLEEMKANIAVRLRQFWDDGIRGPDFVWAATGPAMEAYSKYPVVKKANATGETMSVGEFLKHARKLVVEYVCARVLAPAGDGDGAGDIDPVTTYYLLHRSSFGGGDVPIGPCILFSVSCGLSDAELSDTWDILQRAGAGGAGGESDDGDESEGAASGGKGAKVRLKPWDKRVRKGLGETAPGGRPVPLIDRIHRAVQLRHAGNENDLNHFLQGNALSRNQSFQRVLQALIELAEVGSSERAQFEALSNHVAADNRASAPLSLFPPTSPAA